MVRFHSSRGDNQTKTFEYCCLTSGYAKNGGLMVPSNIPKITFKQLTSWKSLSFPDLCAEVLSLFIEGEIPFLNLKSMARDAFESFKHKTIIPFRQVGPYCILEMFWGPTYAFKDVGIRMQAQFLNYFLSKRNAKANVLISTSGDTGPAAVASVCGLQNVNVFCLYPYSRVTRVQELQLTTIIEPNVTIYRCHENNDILDEILKKIFDDEFYCVDNDICSMNSTNIGRILTQCCHYFYAYLHVTHKIGEEVDFAVPTGACGNSSGGILSKSMGLPIGTLYLCTNANDILHRALSKGDFSVGENVPTLSCAMDIQTCYNLERILYFLFEGDSRRVRRIMSIFERKNQYQFSPAELTHIQWSVRTCSCDDKNTLRIMRTLYEHFGYEICPHSAIAIYGVEQFHPTNPCICIATAHPAKFDFAIRKAIGKSPRSECVKLLYQQEEKCTELYTGMEFRSRWLVQIKKDIQKMRLKSSL